MTTYAPLHSDGTYCEVAARYREGQQSDGDCERSHRWMPTYCDHYHTHTVSTRGLLPGDRVFESGRTVARTERSMTSLNAWVVYYTNGTHDYAGTSDAWMIERI